MKLRQSQIAQVKKFIHSRGFTHIEVEMEILDHVVSAVEEKLEKNPTKSLDKAIQEVHAGFGPLGFSTLEDTFHKSFNKYYRSIQKHELKKYFNSSKGSITLAMIFISLVLSYSLHSLPPAFILTILLVLSTGSWISLYFFFRKTFKKWRKKSLVVGVQLNRIGFGSYFIFYTFYYLDLFFNVEFNSIPLLSLSFFLIGLSSHFTKTCIEEVYSWTNERYLKYVT